MADTKKFPVETLTLREAAAGDEGIINEFFDAMGAESRALFNRRDYNRRGVLKFCARPDASRRYILALSDGVMAGYFFFMDWDTGVPELGLAVRDEWHGMGIGTHLVAEAQKLCRAAGKGGLRLTTHVANLRAQTLYESAGFVCRGVCKNGCELFYLWARGMG